MSRGKFGCFFQGFSIFLRFAGSYWSFLKEMGNGGSDEHFSRKILKIDREMIEILIFEKISRTFMSY